MNSCFRRAASVMFFGAMAAAGAVAETSAPITPGINRTIALNALAAVYLLP